MEIADLITPRSVIPQLRATYKKQALLELAKRAAAMTGISLFAGRLLRPLAQMEPAI